MNEETANGLAMAKLNKCEKIAEKEVINVVFSKCYRRIILLDWSK